MKKIIVAFAMLFALIGCTNEAQIEDKQAGKAKIVAENEKIQITTSIVPLASITNYIGGENVEVNNLVGPGKSPHNFSLTPQNLINIQKSDIVFLLGIQDIDGFLFTSLSGVKSIALDTGLKVLDATSEHDHSDHAEESEGEHSEDHSDEGHDEHSDEKHSDDHNEDEHNEDEHNEEHHDDKHSENEQDLEINKYLAEEGEGHVHAEASIDPHVWTGKVNALIIAKKIQEELTKLQPSQKIVFEENYKAFEEKITNIFDEFSSSVASKKQKEFIVFHDAYNYLLFDAGIDAEKKIVFRSNVMAEPGSADMKELTDEVVLHGLRHFFIEPQFESKALEVFAKQHNGEILRLDPLGKNTEASGFLENIASNLEALSNIYE